MTEALADALRVFVRAIPWLRGYAYTLRGMNSGMVSELDLFIVQDYLPALAAYEDKSSPAKPDAVRVALEALRKIEGIVDGDEWILAWGSGGRIRFHTELIERLCFDAIAALEAEGGEKPDVTPTGAVVAARSGATAGETAPDSLRALAQQGEKG